MIFADADAAVTAATTKMFNASLHTCCVFNTNQKITESSKGAVGGAFADAPQLFYTSVVSTTWEVSSDTFRSREAAVSLRLSASAACVATDVLVQSEL